MLKWRMNTRHDQNIDIVIVVVINVSSVFVFSGYLECEKGQISIFTHFLTGLYLLTDDNVLN